MLRRHGAELYVERHEATARATATACMLFENLDGFLAWATTQAERYQDPLINQELARHGRRLLDRA
ncbi:hypothetical protein CKO44_00340 [Rubrivivax gelatinosus]|nr:hypothetical protein [Rubrivivax gelatinosus]